MNNWKALKRKLRKIQNDRDELVKSLETIHNAAFNGESIRHIQDVILEEEYLRALRVEPLF